MKKIFTMFLSLAMLVSLSAPAFATELEPSYTQEEINAINEANIGKYAMSFVDAVNGDPNLSVGAISTIYSENDNISGYCVDITNAGLPNGYVIVKFSDNNPVVSEFSLGADVVNPYEMIMENANIGADDAIFYSIGSNEYQVFDPSQKVIACDNNEIISEREFLFAKEEAREEKQAQLGTISSSINDPHIDYSDLDGWSVVSDSYEGTVEDDKTITGAGSIRTWYCQDHVENLDKTYACSVVALCNLMKYYRERGYDEISRSFRTLYEDMWEYAGTDSDGSTTNTDVPPAAKNYLKDLGYNCSYSSFLFSTYGDFRSALKKNKPCILSYGAQFGNKKAGHTVLTVGYVETSEWQYLEIVDGWNDYLRYINFNGYDYTRQDGWSFSVSK